MRVIYFKYPNTVDIHYLWGFHFQSPLGYKIPWVFKPSEFGAHLHPPNTIRVELWPVELWPVELWTISESCRGDFPQTLWASEWPFRGKKSLLVFGENRK